MNIEYELKILEIDLEKIRAKLLELGDESLWRKSFRRYVYDMHPPQTEKWIRLRTDGNHTTLTCKHILDPLAIDGVREWEFEVSDFDMANEFLEQMGYAAKSYQENTRESYRYKDCAIELDSRPLIPPYLEIEWENKESVLEVLRDLQLEDSEYTSENTVQIYKRYGIENIDTFPYLWFDKIIEK